MGAWAADSFGNDDAADWVCDLDDHSGLALVREALADVLGAEDYVEAPEASKALAAIEIIAAGLGRPTAAFTADEDAVAWVAKVKPAIDAALVKDALKAIERILADDSELRQLWEESDSAEEWLQEVATLRSALQPA
ncbi:DUF4259 domain-containing protein [Stenotrophomonas sp. LGBM10]|uniref:DUF4259 domain-containing protein n=1 Tax=Stenotrophomonas sp. LGBM10 TaxID=3390038 RepID=UPI00398AD2A0